MSAERRHTPRLTRLRGKRRYLLLVFLKNNYPAFLQGFWRWRRVRKELFSSRVGSADIRRGAPTLVRETALSLVCFSEKLSPRIKCEIFCALAESKERTLQFACRRNADIRRGSHACVGNGVISLLSISKPYPPHKMRDFLCCFAGA